MRKVFEMHTHCLFKIPVEEQVKLYREEFLETGTYKCNFLSCPQESHDGKTLEVQELQNEKCLFFKHAFSPNAYAFAGLEHPADMVYDEKTADNFLRQAETYYEMGFDGMKMLEGYPSFRKATGIPLDHPVFDKFYRFMEEKGRMITLHVGNPAEFWDINKVDPYALKVGRYCDETYPTKQQLQDEVFSVMNKFPRLRLALAHYGFLTDDYKQFDAFLGNYENTLIDITPGGEQYFNMLEDWDTWKGLITKYQDRIFYGTDFYAFPREDDASWRAAYTRRPWLVRNFFETDGEHEYFGQKFRGVKMDDGIVDKIFYKNAERLMGAPRTIDRTAFVSRCRRLLGEEGFSAQGKLDLQYMIDEMKE